jgi:hypothetical protein
MVITTDLQTNNSKNSDPANSAINALIMERRIMFMSFSFSLYHS